MENELLKTEYLKAFDDKRKALICQSYYKYGKASRNFATGNVGMRLEALKSALRSLKKLEIRNIFVT